VSSSVTVSALRARSSCRLDAEAQAQATHLRVEQVARDKLRMCSASPAITHYVTDDGAMLASPSAPQPAAKAPR
jgi:cell division protein FtsL